MTKGGGHHWKRETHVVYYTNATQAVSSLFFCSHSAFCPSFFSVRLFSAGRSALSKRTALISFLLPALPHRPRPSSPPSPALVSRPPSGDGNPSAQWPFSTCFYGGRIFSFWCCHYLVLRLKRKLSVISSGVYRPNFFFQVFVLFTFDSLIMMFIRISVFIYFLTFLPSYVLIYYNCALTFSRCYILRSLVFFFLLHINM